MVTMGFPGNVATSGNIEQPWTCCATAAACGTCAASLGATAASTGSSAGGTRRPRCTALDATSVRRIDGSSTTFIRTTTAATGAGSCWS